MKSSLYVLKRSILLAVCDNWNIQEKNNEGYFPIGFFVEVKLSVKLFNWVIFKWLSNIKVITPTMVKARQKSRVEGVIGFACHWLKNWRDTF